MVWAFSQEHFLLEQHISWQPFSLKTQQKTKNAKMKTRPVTFLLKPTNQPVADGD